MANLQSSKRLRIAVVGAGYVSNHHLSALKSLDFVDIVAVVDRDLDAAQRLAQRFAVALATTNLADVAAVRPDCVYVLTPPSSHASLALQALDMGCHVFVEKPMAETSADCAAMIQRAREKGLQLSVNHSDLFDPVVSRAVAAVKAGACGEILMVDVLRSSEYPPYGGGPLPGFVSKGSYPFQDLGVHALYQIEALLGEIQHLEVSYRSTGKHPSLQFDEWTADVICERGRGRIYLSWNVRPMVNRVVIQGTRGVLELDKFLQTYTLNRLLPGPKFIGLVLMGIANSFSKAFTAGWNVIRFATGRLRGSPGIFSGAIAFARSVHGGTQPPVSAADGARIVALMEAASVAADAERTAELKRRLAPLPPCTCLVTGAAGFVGRALVKRLVAQGETVRVLVRRDTGAWRGVPGLQVVVGDLGDPAIVDHAVAGAGRVFHVGAAMRGGKADFEAGTIWGTRNVVAACVRHGGHRLVYVSSMSVLDHAGRDPSVPVTESARLEPHPDRRGHYTQTKLAAEQIVLDAVRDSGLDAAIVRPGQVFGPGAERVPPNGVIALGSRWICVGNGRLKLPLVYLDDVVDALLAAARSETTRGSIVHVVDSTAVEQREYLSALTRSVSSPPRISYLPRPLMMALAYGVELLGRALRRDVPLSRYRVRSLRPLWPFDTSLSLQKLNWRPPVGTAEGLRRTFPERQ